LRAFCAFSTKQARSRRLTLKEAARTTLVSARRHIIVASLQIVAIWLGALNASTAHTENAARIEIPHGDLPHRGEPLTIEQTVEVRTLAEPHLSPRGDLVAFVVSQSFLDCNCRRQALYVASALHPSAGRQLLEEDSIENIRWTPDGRLISALLVRGGQTQVWGADPSNGGARLLFAPTALQSPRTLVSYEWSHSGNELAYAMVGSESEGPDTDYYLYDDERQGENLDHAASLTRVELWVHDSQQERRIFTTSSNANARIAGFAWSHNDRQLSVSYSLPFRDIGRRERNDDAFAVAIVNAGSGEFVREEYSGNTGTPVWSPDDRSLAVLAVPDETLFGNLFIADSRTGRSRLVLEGVVGLGRGWMNWSSNGSKLFFESKGRGLRQDTLGLYQLNIATRAVERITPLDVKISRCDRGYPIIACIHQSPSTPPAIARVDQAKKTSRRLVDPNPELASVPFLTMRPLRWINQYGIETTGYLLTPPASPNGSRPPLLLVAYGFDGDFITQANPNTYPAEAFARSGFAVLLVNYPRWLPWEGRDFARGSVGVGYGPLASWRTIIDQLSNDGVIDRNRVGFMGTSFGGLLAQFAATHSKLFSAFEVNNASSASEPNRWWYFGSATERQSEEHFMGGPPFGPTLRNYESFSPALLADRVSAPILMQFDGPELPSAMEWYEALRSQRAPVELIVYPDESHTFIRPRNRVSAMRRTLQWFMFWLTDQRVAAPIDPEQYRRWGEMRSLLH
jgi:dipeptidyl aminopeptidase/acylaminoacyl peptidase